MAQHVIVGAGPSGLYTAYRLLKDGNLPPGDIVTLFEWSQRVGGRINTFTFPPDVAEDGLYCEFGGMRFATDERFPKVTDEGHRLVQSIIIELGLEGAVVDFDKSADRLYYLRGTHVYESELRSGIDKLPYGFNDEFRAFLAHVTPPYTADAVIGAIAGLFAPGLDESNAHRGNWCRYFATGAVPDGAGSPSFPAGTPVREIGYWNLLYDQLGDEGYDYAADANGYSSNVINWNAADAFENNNDVGSSTNYKRLDGGYGILFDTLAQQIEELAIERPGSGISVGQQLVRLDEADDGTTTCTFVDGEGTVSTVVADTLFLAMPRRSLELVAGGCAPEYMLNRPEVKLRLESSINQPAIKAVLVFDEAWWTTAPFAPRLQPSTDPGVPETQWVGGPTVTDLPLRMIDYFANNVPGGPGKTGGPYVLLASYDDMSYASFWRELETSGDHTVAPSLVRQPLTGPTSVPVDSALAGLLIKQLAEVHGLAPEAVPAPAAVYFQDWGQDPYGAGYHGWASHFDICDVMDTVRAPYQKILGGSSHRTYVIGSCYSFDQGWVEGALCTAESVLQEFFSVAPLNGVTQSDYTLVCMRQTGEGTPA